MLMVLRGHLSIWIGQNWMDVAFELYLGPASAIGLVEPWGSLPAHHILLNCLFFGLFRRASAGSWNQVRWLRFRVANIHSLQTPRNGVATAVFATIVYPFLALSLIVICLPLWGVLGDLTDKAGSLSSEGTFVDIACHNLLMMMVWSEAVPWVLYFSRVALLNVLLFWVPGFAGGAIGLVLVSHLVPLDAWVVPLRAGLVATSSALVLLLVLAVAERRPKPLY